MTLKRQVPEAAKAAELAAGDAGASPKARLDAAKAALHPFARKTTPLGYVPASRRAREGATDETAYARPPGMSTVWRERAFDGGVRFFSRIAMVDLAADEIAAPERLEPSAAVDVDVVLERQAWWLVAALPANVRPI